MGINIDRAFEIDNGVIINDPDTGDTSPFITGGPASPVGLDLPIDTLYLQKSGTKPLLWQKFGAGTSDWRQLSAVDIPFDPTGTDIDASATDVQAAIESLSNFRFQYAHFQLIGSRNYDSYLYAGNDYGSITRESGDASNGYQFSNSAPLLAGFSGNVVSATAAIRGVAQSTGAPAASCEILFELYNVGFSGEGTKLGDITFDISSSTYTIGNFWNSSVQTEFSENQTQNIAITKGNLLGLKFIRQTGNDKIVAFTNATILLEIKGSA